jgi:hypothetical protein
MKALNVLFLLSLYQNHRIIGARIMYCYQRVVMNNWGLPPVYILSRKMQKILSGVLRWLYIFDFKYRYLKK